MSYATIDDVKENAIFRAFITQLTDPEIERLLRRAERQLERELERKFDDVTDVDTLFDLNVATVYQVDLLYMNSNAELAHLRVNGIQSEKKGEYTVQFGSTEQAIRQFEQFASEYNSIIESLKIYSSNNFSPVFRVGKRRKRVDLYEPD